uniref:Uncharacterized protein n=1 Tax=Anguilla anguilla TaxID=7936 RepID=A0A0E9WCL2_ANGAN
MPGNIQAPSLWQQLSGSHAIPQGCTSSPPAAYTGLKQQNVLHSTLPDPQSQAKVGKCGYDTKHFPIIQQAFSCFT